MFASEEMSTAVMADVSSWLRIEAQVGSLAEAVEAVGGVEAAFRELGRDLAENLGGRADSASLDDTALIDLISVEERLSRVHAARRTRLVAELARRRPGDERGVSSDDTAAGFSRWAPDELGCALGLSRTTARARLVEAARLEGLFPDTLRAWEQGRIDETRARIVHDATLVLADDDLARAVEPLVLPEASQQTWAQVRACAREAVLRVDPEGANRRHHEARKRRLVDVYAEDDGMSALRAVLPATEADAVWHLLTNLSKSLTDDRTLDQRRADLVADLLLGRLTVTDLRSTNTTGTGSPATATATATATAAISTATATATAAISTATATGSASVDTCTACTACTATDGGAACSTTDACTVGGATDGCAAADGRAVADGCAAADGCATTGGSAITGGCAATDGCATTEEGGCGVGARPSRSGRTTRTSVQVVVGIDTLTGASDQPGHLVGYGSIPADLAREAALDGVWRRLVADPLSGALLDHGRTSYRPPKALADFVRARDQVCRFPTCRRRAVDADLDHRRRWADGGVTSAENLSGYCPHHHRLKEQPDWEVLAHPDGVLTWITPTGHRHVSRPHDYRPHTSRPPDPTPAPRSTLPALLAGSIPQAPDQELPDF
ncbi:HNH endonuclease signature motif containing protein [Pseudonocardia pini]|uniref:HNH endonuclease signature motif containing protein n=1 Tax=Pseudonocardia pini TaxID=2758030 RepID=UPI0015F04123|nr:HNH endonuclease signature motif containing protein [Pseudonocardia pini]